VISSEKAERAFLQHYDPGAFERPSVSVDVVVFTVMEGDLWVALYQRDEHPHRGRYALPGGFVGFEEGLEAAARRLLREKVGLRNIFFEQLRAFGAPKRDPRMRIITVAFYALTSPATFEEVLCKKNATVARVQTPTGASAYANNGKRLRLAFDHGEILQCATKGLRQKLDHSAVGYRLLPESFTLRALQGVHEAIRGEALNKDSFRRRMLATGDLRPTGKKEAIQSFRPAELYHFNQQSAV
jgi:8-oxo-dGTP diphosphatase